MITVSGHLFGYYYICKRKIWFSVRKLEMEQNSELVAVGKLLDENTYGREKHNFMLEDVANIDFLKSKVVHEVKKSGAQSQASVAQVKFYLYHLRVRGVEGVRGKINFPTERRTADVELNDADMEEIPRVINEIREIAERPLPPAFEIKKICRACAYYDLCAI